MIQGVSSISPVETITPKTSALDAQSGSFAEKLGINQNSLSKVNGDPVAEGIGVRLNSLVRSEARLHGMGANGGGAASRVKVIDTRPDPVGSTGIDANKSTSDTNLQHLTNAFEYSSNMALVSLVLNGMTNGISTLTSRGG